MPPHCYIGHMSYYFLLLAAVNVNAVFSGGGPFLCFYLLCVHLLTCTSSRPRQPSDYLISPVVAMSTATLGPLGQHLTQSMLCLLTAREHLTAGVGEMQEGAYVCFRIAFLLTLSLWTFKRK